MSFVRIMVHLVWSTKERQPLITSDMKSDLLNHIKANSIEKGIFIDTINCVSDHVHLLISLGADQSIGKVTQLLKGESSHWVNEQKLSKRKFEWQNDYLALSVSESMVDTVREYIRSMDSSFE
jgi:putative transposase